MVLKAAFAGTDIVRDDRDAAFKTMLVAKSLEYPSCCVALFAVPIPRFENFDALNAWLEEQCLKRHDEVLRGHAETIGERLMRDLDALMVLPPAPYDACEKVSTRATSISMVRYRSNDYSVPVAYAHHEVQVRGYVHEVVIGCGADVIARHRRSYEKADMVFDPMHFLPLLEQKVGALDQAAPLQGWDLPNEFAILHRLLEARMGKKGKREYVQVLRLLESFEMAHVQGAIKQALELGAIGGACPRARQRRHRL